MQQQEFSSDDVQQASSETNSLSWKHHGNQVFAIPTRLGGVVLARWDNYSRRYVPLNHYNHEFLPPPFYYQYAGKIEYASCMHYP
jgi:hypothetical protein